MVSFASSSQLPQLADVRPAAAWPKTLATLLPKSRPYLDAVIDSGGGPIVNQVTRVMKHGGVVSCYGMTAGGDVSVGMGAVLKNINFKGTGGELLAFRKHSSEHPPPAGSTMGSRDEFKKAVAFISEHKIKPIVHTVLPGLDKAEEGFEIMKRGGQFGKVRFSSTASALQVLTCPPITDCHRCVD